MTLFEQIAQREREVALARGEIASLKSALDGTVDQRDRAEADAAALYKELQSCHANAVVHEGTDWSTVQCRIALVLQQPNPGQRYLDLEEHLDHTETDRDGLEGLLQQISDAMGCKQYRYTAATKRVLDLAKLVEGLPKLLDVSVEADIDSPGRYCVIHDDEDHEGSFVHTFQADSLTKEEADALAKLLAWRQGGEK